MNEEYPFVYSAELPVPARSRWINIATKARTINTPLAPLPLGSDALSSSLTFVLE
jgi:hypothetical protein